MTGSGWSSRSTAPGPTASRATRPTSWSARCGRRSRRWAREPPGPAARLHATSYPHARGLGSSSAAIVAGLSLARGAGRRRPAAARRRGGLPARRRDRGPPGQRGAGVLRRLRDLRARRRRLLRRAVRRSTRGSAPSCSSRRTRCRPRSPAGCCRPTVPHADAAADAGRTALLVAALAGQPEHLLPRHPTTACTRSTARPAMPDIARRWSTRCAADGVAGGRLRRRPDRARVHRPGRRRRPLDGSGAPAGWAARTGSTSTRTAPGSR